LLIGSLAVNFIVAGLMVGATVGNKRSGDRPPREGDILGAYTQALTGQERREIGKSIRDHHRAQGEKPLRPREVLQQMLAALKAEPFDPEAVRTLIDEQSETAFARRKVAQELWLQHITDMSPKERAAYAVRIEEVLSKRKGPPKRN
jgi:uncharacterized membrane protein